MDVVDGQESLDVEVELEQESQSISIIEHDLPIKFVEFRNIRQWLKYLNPDVIPISRNTTKVDVLKIHMREKEKLKELMVRIPSRISLTYDLWTTCTTKGYICLTAHFIDTNWRLNSKILNFCHMPPPHIGHELSKKILDFLIDWGTKKKIFSWVVQEHLKSQLVLQNNGLLCDEDFFHVNCSTHVLNLIVKERQKVCSKALEKIRDSVIYVRGSESRMKKFKECIERVGGVDTSASLCLDVPTSLHFHDENYTYCPSVEEWKIGEKIYVFLLPFYETTNLILEESYHTSNFYFLQVSKIQCVILASLNDDDGVFEKYWEEYSVVPALGAVLNPRIKLSLLEYCYSKVDASTSESKLQKVKNKLYKLFKHYSFKEQNTTTTQGTPISNIVNEPKSSFSQLLFNLVCKIGKSQLEVYLEESNLDFSYHENLDVLHWWKDNNNRYPDLSLMASDLLSIPMTIVASKSAFSIGFIVLGKYRSRLLSKNANALICTHNWLLGFVNDNNLFNLNLVIYYYDNHLHV
ncbi:hypothetical protein JHK84_027983 [Glycine max]|uniref:HAT C-terminal dimerisation domain-containing protein n=1 Tax=Glycine max TaxID=3847 RepID=A0A0R0HS05_SOYBN|nr:hypothetical protein JHK85_028389 [Glycine max]KAG5003728.1 hypothetical protein JHK86_027867 [Glycine max]KAG5151511.1 hypothetical protein JHK84_027983 [Glycine max]